MDEKYARSINVSNHENGISMQAICEHESATYSLFILMTLKEIFIKGLERLPKTMAGWLSPEEVDVTYEFENEAFLISWRGGCWSIFIQDHPENLT